MTDESSYRDNRHPTTCLCAECKESYRVAQIEEMRRRDAERDRRATERRRERERRQRSRLLLKVGAVVSIGLIFFGAWGVWALLSTPQQDSGSEFVDSGGGSGELIDSVDGSDSNSDELVDSVVGDDNSGNGELVDSNGEDGADGELVDSVNSRIAFVALDSNSVQQIYTIEPDGSNLMQLTDNPPAEGLELVWWLGRPAWSPDGSRIAFTHNRNGEPHQIYTISPDGSGLRQLTDNEFNDMTPSWSPNGERIAFASDRDGDFEIYIVEADRPGVILRQATDNEFSDLNPSWGRHPENPDNQTAFQLAFQSDRNTDRNGDWDIYTMRWSGRNLRQISGTRGNHFNPSWSPDGSRFAWDWVRLGDDVSDNTPVGSDIFVSSYTRVNGGGLRDKRTITANQSDNRYPSWSPDGSRIAFASNRTGHWEIYTMLPDGSDVTRITDNQYNWVRGLTWSPALP